MKAVILAGGEGTRLRPYTYMIPKPLMPVGELPIIEIIIRQLKNNGFNNVVILTGYKADLMEMFLKGSDVKYDLKIKFSREEEPLGTIGPLSLIRNDLNEDFILMNGDTLTNMNYTELMRHHRESDNMITIAIHKKEIYLDFGIVKLNGGNISDYIEKPTNAYFVSMGVYVFNPEVLKYVPNSKLDFPDLVKILLRNGEQVGGYVSEDYWLDIGRHEDYLMANQNVELIYNLMNI